MKTFTEQDLRAREQQLMSEAGEGSPLPAPLYVQFEALRDFFRDLGLHDAAKLVSSLEDAFDARMTECF